MCYGVLVLHHDSLYKWNGLVLLWNEMENFFIQLAKLGLETLLALSLKVITVKTICQPIFFRNDYDPGECLLRSHSCCDSSSLTSSYNTIDRMNQYEYLGIVLYTSLTSLDLYTMLITSWMWITAGMCIALFLYIYTMYNTHKDLAR